MFKGGLKPVIIIGVGIGLIVLFLLMPRQPWGKSAKSSTQPEMSASESRLQQAIELVNGPNPMAGITMLMHLRVGMTCY